MVIPGVHHCTYKVRTRVCHFTPVKSWVSFAMLSHSIIFSASVSGFCFYYIKKRVSQGNLISLFLGQDKQGIWIRFVFVDSWKQILDQFFSIISNNFLVMSDSQVCTNICLHCRCCHKNSFSILLCSWHRTHRLRLMVSLGIFGAPCCSWLSNK